MKTQPILTRSNFSTVIDILRWRSEVEPNKTVYRFLADGETERDIITYKHLDRKCRAIGAALQRQGLSGERALLLYPPGIEYIAAFFGCLYAMVIPVPLYPPRPHQRSQKAGRLRGVLEDAQPAIALTSTELAASATALLEGGPVSTQATDRIALELADKWAPPTAGLEHIAFLQYTSGSTAQPKGVMVTHGNLLHNTRLMQECFELGDTSRSVIWLPPYHDMGLIGGIIAPICVGFEAVLMPPALFLQRPARWLKAISRFRATVSGGPNFAYELCVRHISPEQSAGLDLSTWRVAFNGAEPVRSETIERFTETFRSSGFRREAVCPCYGLAEATLIVSGSRASEPPVARPFRSADKPGGVVEPGDGGQALASSGRGFNGERIKIVDPEKRQACSERHVGEIWIQGPSVAAGYWRRPEETEQVFRARLETEQGPFLRTGDLGFLSEDELYVTARLKDLIIIRGRNYYPQDIELTVERCSPGLRPGAGAAFAVNTGRGEGLAIVQEVERQWRRGDLNPLIETIRRAVAEQHEIEPCAIVLVKPGSIPKTTSGKVQRFACREDLSSGLLDCLACSTLPSDWQDARADAVPFADMPPMDRPAAIRTFLQSQIALRLGSEPGSIDLGKPLLSLGIDSLSSVEIQHALESVTGFALPLSTLLGEATVDEIATAMAVADGSFGSLPAAVSQQDETPFPLSHGQRALWYLNQIATAVSAYNLVSAMRTTSVIDVEAFERALMRLMRRHACLRTRFIDRDGEPFQAVDGMTAVPLYVEDWTGSSDDNLRRRMAELAHQPFDLRKAPLFNIYIFQRNGIDQHLLFIFHHIIVDLWSFAVLARDLGAAYRSEVTGCDARLAPLPLQYSDYVRWQSDLLDGPVGASLWDYWQQRLSGDLPVLELPTDRPRPPVETFNGASKTLTLDAELTAGLRDLSREHGATLYMTLLAAFEVLLSRHSGANDVLVGSPVSGRISAEFDGVVGYFTNPVVLRGDLSGNPPFRDFLRQLRQTTLDAFDHQALPFALLAQRLQPVRDPSRSPVFQAMFMLQTSPLAEGDDLGVFGIGGEGGTLAFGDVKFESVPVKTNTAQFDVTLAAAEANDVLLVTLQYNTALFDASTAERLLDHFRAILSGIVRAPDCRVRALPMLSEGDRQQILEEWNDTASDLNAFADCLHQEFEAQVLKTPAAVALIYRDTLISYESLNRSANLLAHYLRGLGVGSETRVGICVERSPNLVIAMLAILKAGGTYVPLDPSYPPDWLTFVLKDSRAPVILVSRLFERLIAGLDGGQPIHLHLVNVDDVLPSLAQQDGGNPAPVTTRNSSAYVIYTSGSTGTPKGVVVEHRSVVNLFHALDRAAGCGPFDTLLAVTSVSFDISVLELLWTISRGARVVLLPDQLTALSAPPVRVERQLDFSLFYFSSDSPEPQSGKYRLVLDGAKFADRHGFRAVWTPERHFHEFGGSYPNPAVLGAMLAGITERVHIRAGSVVLPLHDPIRVAEEWSLVDNLSNGRTGIAFASGWHADDFVFRPNNYAARKDIMFRDIDLVQRLWSGEAIHRLGGSGKEVAIRTYPRPIQKRLPIWITAAGSADTFTRAGEIGAGVLTHLLGQTVEDLAEQIKLYRQALEKSGHPAEAGHVVLMLHSFIGRDREEVRRIVREPFTAYLRSSVSLIANLARSLNLSVDLYSMPSEDMKALLSHAFERYFETGALFGDAKTVQPLIGHLKDIGVDEIACLVDFGMASTEVLGMLEHLAEVREAVGARTPAADYSLAAQAVRYRATMLQCTPSFMRMILVDGRTTDALRSLRWILLGGEALPTALANEVLERTSARLMNMYGPTETTVWSCTHEVDRTDSATVPIGRPILNTRVYVLDDELEPVPAGASGELWIGGEGLARGYLFQPELTAERFVRDPFTAREGDRMYRTGDIVRFRPNGVLEFLGRKDDQVKLHGFRIELAEIEAVLSRQSGVREAVACVCVSQGASEQIVAYAVPERGAILDTSHLRENLRTYLPPYMVPAAVVILETLPLTPNGKVDRKKLPQVKPSYGDRTPFVAPQNQLENDLASIWRDLVGHDQIGANDNFFDVGGNSLLMVQLQNQIRTRLHIDVPLVTLLERPTIGSLAEHVRQDGKVRPEFRDAMERAERQRASRQRRARPERAP